MNNQSRRDRHVVTPEVVYLGYVLGERQVKIALTNSKLEMNIFR
jgi:hypothetical protein